MLVHDGSRRKRKVSIYIPPSTVYTLCASPDTPTLSFPTFKQHHDMKSITRHGKYDCLSNRVIDTASRVRRLWEKIGRYKDDGISGERRSFICVAPPKERERRGRGDRFCKSRAAFS
jgi:hypothetical protein